MDENYVEMGNSSPTSADYAPRAANRDLEYSCDDVVIKNADINDRKIYSMTILKAMQNGKTTTLSTYLNGSVSDE